VKEEETFWQAFVLLLVFTVAVGIYGLLAVGLIRLRQSGQATAVATPLLTGEPLQIIEPLNDAILQGGQPISVSAVLAEPGAIRAEMEVDGRSVAVAVNPKPQSDQVPAHST